jgi:polar amino acid transport system permease protein
MDPSKTERIHKHCFLHARPFGFFGAQNIPLHSSPADSVRAMLARMLTTSPPRLILRATSFLFALACLSGIVVLAFVSIFTRNPADHSKILYQWNWAGVWSYRQLFWDGWLATLAITAITLPVSCVIGVLLALARRSSFLPLKDAARIFVEITRCTPLLVQLVLYYYIVGTALHIENRYIAGPIILAAFEGAYISEIVRAGIESVGGSQLESARAIGLTRSQTYRYVIAPQAIRQMLPALAGQLVSLVKDSSLLGVIGLAEFYKETGDVYSNTFTIFECYLPLAVGYLIITLPISLWTQRLERRLRYET